MEILNLFDICKPKQWKALSKSALIDSGYPVYGANGIIGFYKEYNHENDTLTITCRGATCGTINLAKGKSYITGNAMCLDDLSPKLDVRYLELYLKNYDFNTVITGAAQPQITRESLKKVFVPIPDLNEQKIISERLYSINKVMKDREKEIELIDNLIKSRFVEMFGRYEWNSTIGDYIAELRGGKSLAGTEPCKNKVLKTGAATFEWFDSEQYKYLPEDYKPLPEHKVETGDVMISRMNTPELVGACSYVFKAPEDMYYPDRLWKVITKNNANPIFLWQLLWDSRIRRQIKEKSGGTSGTMHNISKPKLLEIKCISAPIEKQNVFADFVKQINKSKFVKQ